MSVYIDYVSPMLWCFAPLWSLENSETSVNRKIELIPNRKLGLYRVSKNRDCLMRKIQFPRYYFFWLLYWVHHGIATAIASDFLNCRRNHKEFLQREASLAIFIAKRIATATVSLPQRKSPPRIWTSLWAPLAAIRCCWPYNETWKNRCVQFWQRKRSADFHRKSSPGDGALRSYTRNIPASKNQKISPFLIFWFFEFLNFWAWGCESVRPLQGSKSPKSGKDGFGVKKLPLPSVPEMGALSQKNPHFSTGLRKEMGIFLPQSAHFLGTWKWGFLDPETLFSRFWRFWPL